MKPSCEGLSVDYSGINDKPERKNSYFSNKTSAAGQISVYNHDYNLRIDPGQLTLQARTRLWGHDYTREGLGSIAGWRG